MSTKPYYRSLSVWVAPAFLQPGTPNTAVAVVRGSLQEKYAQAQEWRIVSVTNHNDIPALLASGAAQAVVTPMATALSLMRDKALMHVRLEHEILSDPLLSGDVCISIDPKRPELVDQINAAINQIKRDGRFDKINSKFLPLKLQ